ncbi:exodeoxyribonuclease V subunit gamma [Naumannella huperziae]
MSQPAPDRPQRPGLFIHHGPDPTVLAGVLADLLVDPLPDPFAFEVVSVPSPGVERWLSQTLAARLGAGPAGDGVAAGIDYRSLEKLITGAVDAGAGADDPWASDRLPWLVLQAMLAAREEDWFGTVQRHAWPKQNPGGRAWATADRIAGLFRGYAAQRPELIRRWRDGADAAADGTPLPADRVWQPRLFRLAAELAQAPDPVQRLTDAVAALRAKPARAGLPQRLAIFGPTRLSTDQLAVIDALAAHRAVHLFTPHASPAAWRAIAELGPRPAGPRAADDSWRVVRNPLVNRLGRDARELQLRLATSTGVPLAHDLPVPDPPVPDPPVPDLLTPDFPAGDASETLLGRLQADLRADRAPSPGAVADTSIAIHRSHGPDRQVEVLREALLGLLADDPTLQPRDIVVMCPDIETFAPLISATFGLADGPGDHPGHQLRVRLADRSLVQLNPLLAVLAELLALADARAGLSQVLDLCAQPPVARAFGFTPDDLERLAELAEGAGVRWGLDAGHRSRFAMGGFGQNTWQAGLDRMLLGIAMDADGQHFLGTALPLGDVDSSDVALIGRLAELLARLRRICAELARPHDAAGWVAALRDALEQVSAVPSAESWQLAHAHATLAELAPPGEASTSELTPSDVSAMLADAFRGRPSRANFRTGSLTMCTLTPMRSVPHRVVCLLGMDSDRFPRTVTPDGDDLLALDPWVGDRDPRSEDRQLLLDAIMATRQHLMIIHSGTSERTGERREPAIPVQELTDALQTMIGPDGLAAITTDHPLQPFAPDNFREPEPLSFDALALTGARAAAAPPREPIDPWRATGLARTDPAAMVELSDLTAFYTHPAREFLRQRAGLSLWAQDDPPPDEIPVELDGLALWQIGDRMLTAALAGSDPDRVVAAEWRSGAVPPRNLGAPQLDRLRRDVIKVRDAALDLAQLPASSHQVLAAVGERQVFGVIPGVRGNDIVEVTFSGLGARHRIVAWLRLLALTVAEPGRPWRSVIIAKSGSRTVLGPVARADARARLHDLLIVRDLGLRAPLPLPLTTAATYAEIAHTGREPGPDDLRHAWERDADEIWTRWYAELGDLERPRAGREDAGNSEPGARESRRMRALARRVWQPLLDAEASG